MDKTSHETKMSPLMQGTRLALTVLAFLFITPFSLVFVTGPLSLLLLTIGFLVQKLAWGYYGSLIVTLPFCLAITISAAYAKTRRDRDKTRLHVFRCVLISLVAALVISAAAIGEWLGPNLMSSFFAFMADMHRSAMADMPGRAADPNTSPLEILRVPASPVQGHVFIAAYVAFVVLACLTMGLTQSCIVYLDFRKAKKHSFLDVVHSPIVVVALLFAFVPAVVSGHFAFQGINSFVRGFAIMSVVDQNDTLYKEMVTQYEKHQANAVAAILAPNRSVSAYGARLCNVHDLEFCPKDFADAFRKHRDAWTDLGVCVEQNTGIQGVHKAYRTTGLSLLEAWVEKVPNSIDDIKNSEHEMKIAGERQMKEMESCVGWFGLDLDDSS